MNQAIDFYFEFYSPYGYLASQRIENIAERHGRRVTWRPFMLGATFQITGHQPLTNTPLMGEYTLLDLSRSARLQGSPFQMPEEFPKVSLSCARAFYALVDEHPEQAIALAKAIYYSIFSLGKDGTDLTLIAELADSLGIDSAALLEAIQDTVVKNRLKHETTTAIERGVFGSPFIIVDEQPFWGNDRLDQLNHWLETGGW